MNLDEIYLFNPHFESQHLESSPCKIKRRIFNKLVQGLESKFIISLQGLRRVGKTVLLNQLSEHFVSTHKLEPRHFLRFSFDLEDNLELLPFTELDELLKLYFEKILKSNPGTIKERIIITLDEVQNVANWQNVVKKYYDLNQNIKFVISGSSSLYLCEEADSLAGRIIEYSIPCLDFDEFLLLTESPLQLENASSLSAIKELRARPVSAELQKAFETFLLIGGFPDTAIMSIQGFSILQIQDFVRKSIVNKVIRKDLKRYFNVSDTNIDYRLFELCCVDSGTFFENSKIAGAVGLSATSIKRHFDIFAQSALISTLNKFDRKLRRAIRATKKVYVSSPCLMFAMAYKQTCEDSAFVGHAAETYAFNKLSSYTSRFFVYRGKSGNEEIDFYLPDDKLLIESKYSNKIDSRDFGFLFSQSNQLKIGHLVLTKNSFGDKDLNALPLMFL